MMRRRAALAVALLVLVLPIPAGAAEPLFRMSDIESDLMCPTCQSRLDMSHSPAADRIRAFIEEKRQLGWTEQEVKDALVADFGPAVLAAPPARGLGLVAWLVPLLAVGGGVVILIGAVAVWRRRAPAIARAAAPAAPPDAAIDARIDAALAELDDPGR
ncbi:MAG: cytochrome c-type biogenesis protein [Gaiellales bacterium]